MSLFEMLILNFSAFNNPLEFLKKPFTQKENLVALLEVNVYGLCMWIMLAAYPFIPECKANVNHLTKIPINPSNHISQTAKMQ